MKLLTTLLLTAICFTALAQNISIKDGIASVDGVPYCKIIEPGRTGPAAKLVKKVMGNSEYDVAQLDGTLLLSLKLEGSQMLQYYQCTVVPFTERYTLNGDLQANKLIQQMLKYKVLNEEGQVNEQGLRLFLTANAFQTPLPGMQSGLAVSAPLAVYPDNAILSHVMVSANSGILFQGRPVGTYSITEYNSNGQIFQTIQLFDSQGVANGTAQGLKFNAQSFRLTTTADARIFELMSPPQLDVQKVQALAAILLQMGLWR
jgi:hypothetical protein